jgi:polysaccharide deacetylase family sporulation protein PdaB
MVIYLSRRAALAALVLVTALAGLGVTRVMSPAVRSVVALLTGRLVPIYKVDLPEKKVAFSFDATWGTEQTDSLLEILKENQVRTTFFLAGHWVESYPEYVRKIAAAGHEIGNHSYAHAHMNSLTPDQIRADLSRNHAMIRDLTGQEPDLFRPPYGEYGNKLIEEAKQMGYHIIQWSIDSLDWKDVSAAFMVERVLQANPGDIVLFHNAGKHTPEAVAQLLPELKRRGFAVVPVSELIFKSDYYVESHSGVQKRVPVPQAGAARRPM